VSLAVVSILYTGGKILDSDWVIAAMVLSMPYVALGFFTWLFVRQSNRPVALGILLGCATPFLIVFIVTGGCGLFMF